MSSPTIKSQPTYSSLSIGSAGRRHLLLMDRIDLPAGALAPASSLSGFGEIWRVAADSRVIPGFSGEQNEELFRSETHLLIALRRRLLEEQMGLRLYAAGSEPFVWSVYGVATEFGMSREELQLYACGSLARRVYCNHCRTITERVTTNIFDCSGCSAKLFVRDHFSRRLNAYAGVQVDAEVPGEFPELEVLYK